MHLLEGSALGLSRDVLCAPCGWAEVEPSESTTSVGPRQRAVSHGHVLIAHAAGMEDVGLGTGYFGYCLDDGALGEA